MKSKVRTDTLPIAVFAPLGDCRGAEIYHRHNCNQTVRSNEQKEKGENTEKGSRATQSEKVRIDPDLAWFQMLSGTGCGHTSNTTLSASLVQALPSHSWPLVVFRLGHIQLHPLQRWLVLLLLGFFWFGVGCLFFVGFFKKAFLGRQIKHVCTFKWISQLVAQLKAKSHSGQQAFWSIWDFSTHGIHFSTVLLPQNTALMDYCALRPSLLLKYLSEHYVFSGWGKETILHFTMQKG